MRDMADLDEFGRIARHLAPLALAEPGARGLLDDVAVLPLGVDGAPSVITTDTLIEGVHFLASDPPGDVARKALRVNLSDLAAKGAAPAVYFLNLMLPGRLDDDWLGAFAAGLRLDQDAFGIVLAGGDSTTTPGPLAISITAIGRAAGDATPSRSDARAGDDIYVSGSIGDGYLGLQAAMGRFFGAGAEACITRYRLPEPRLALGSAIAGHVTASMDVSDGLIGDLQHIARASGVDCEVTAPAVPVSNGAVDWLAEDPARMIDLLTGGDDYEILFTAPRDRAEAIRDAAARSETSVTRIGAVVAGGGTVRVLDSQGDALDLPSRTGYRHA